MEYIEVGKLSTRDINPRKISDNDLQKLKNSIEKDPKFLEARPLLVNKTGDKLVVYGGNQRLRAVRELGWDKVPVVIENNLDESLMRERAIKDNTEYGQHDYDILSEHFTLEEIQGFDLPEHEINLEEFTIEQDLDEENEDTVPQMDDVEIIVERGDIFQLGDHRIGCMDATDFTHLDALMGKEKFDMVFTDPPYNTGMSEKTNGDSTRLNHMFDDNYTDAERDEFMHKFTASYDYLMKDDTVAYICLDWRRNHELIPHIKNYFHLSNIIIWDKVVHGLGSDYKYTYEVINVCKKGKPKMDTHQGDREYSDVWHIQRKMGKDEDHATKKPLELVERGIRHASKRNDIVGDLFLGSGITLLACEKHNRICYGTERDPKYIQVILKRYHDYTKGSKEIKCINRDLDLSPVLETGK